MSYALPPGGDGSEIGRYFQEESAPYARWLEHACPALDAFFVRLAMEQHIPLVRLVKPYEELHGVIIEDVGPALLDAGAEHHFRQYSHGRPCIVSLEGSRLMPDFQSLQLRFMVSARVRRSALEPILEGVVDILLRTRGGL